MSSRFASKPSARSGGQGNVAVRMDGEFSRAHPTLMEFLTRTAYDDGKARQVSTITLMAEEGAWKGCLNDRDCLRSVWVTGDAPGAVLDALEATLSGEAEPDWRYYQAWKGGKKK